MRFVRQCDTFASLHRNLGRPRAYIWPRRRLMHAHAVSGDSDMSLNTALTSLSISTRSDAVEESVKMADFHHSRTVRHSAPPFALPHPPAPPVVVLLGRSLTCANPTGYIQSSSAPVNPPGHRRLALGPALAVSVISPGRILPARPHFAPRQRWPFGVERPLSRANPTRSPKRSFPCVCAVARLVTAIPPLPCLGLPPNGNGVRQRLRTLYPAGPQLLRAMSENRRLGRLTRRPGDSMPAV
ncbi:hypothetical protein K466DRAFT_17537 [Polyporus arcularius HHB13444]|uniref:Uncharacterized protein n=1 Tax=Polyporus arcularius HHB13444 TaxID=1314778 RepID=A0A5C3NP74_9APHY|nr:hypothetical protein K466DRAFT_17537 [Polyporus arcularius HHB13444]